MTKPLDAIKKVMDLVNAEFAEADCEHRLEAIVALSELWLSAEQDQRINKDYLGMDDKD